MTDSIARRSVSTGPSGGPSTGGTGADSRAPAAPWARRLAGSRWRDPRLVVGVVLLAVSVLLGARLLSAPDSGVAVWTLRHDAAAGTALSAEDLQARTVTFSDSRVAGRYLPASAPIPQASTLVRPVDAGELLPRDALAAASSTSVTELPLSVQVGSLPADLAVGQTVDVWVVPSSDAGDPADLTGASASSRPGVAAQAQRVLAGVVVRDVTGGSAMLGAGTYRQVLVGLGPDDTARLDRVLAAMTAGDVVVVRHAG